MQYLWNRTLECNTRSKDLQNRTPDGTLVALAESDMKEIQGVCLRQPLGDNWKLVRKTEVGSRVSFRGQIETEAVMRLWERG